MAKVSRIKKESWLVTKPIAHRGLWNQIIVENSLSAYENAAKNGFPIEIDLFLSSDEILMSFHDDDLFRMTGKHGKIYNSTYLELRELRLNGTEEKIPSLEEVLEVVHGRVPILIEIKTQPNAKVVDVLIELLKNYKGEIAIQSFNPLYLRRVKKLAPQILRGILASENAPIKSRIKRFIIKHMSFNFLCKPDFISYAYTGLPLPKRKIKNKVVLAWTITSKELMKSVKPFSDNIIFEEFTP